MSSSNCCFLACMWVSQEAGQVVWYSHLLQNFPQFIVIHQIKGFGIVNKAEIDVFLELSCFLDDPADFGNLISCFYAFSKTSLNIWKYSVHVLLKPGWENFGDSDALWLFRCSLSLLNSKKTILLLTISSSVLQNLSYPSFWHQSCNRSSPLKLQPWFNQRVPQAFETSGCIFE